MVSGRAFYLAGARDAIRSVARWGSVLHPAIPVKSSSKQVHFGATAAFRPVRNWRRPVRHTACLLIAPYTSESWGWAGFLALSKDEALDARLAACRRWILRFGNSKSRIFIFALCNCDFELPIEQSSISAIS